ncbi:MAG: four helix bundle protein, partial [bacterium]
VKTMDKVPTKSANTARGFEDLRVFALARELTKQIYEMTRSVTFAKDRGLTDQIRRASVSILSNIAEGFERETNAEFIRFLYIAKGSSGEVRAQLLVASDQKYISNEACEEMVKQCRHISSMLSKFIQYLESVGPKRPRRPLR